MNATAAVSYSMIMIVVNTDILLRTGATLTNCTALHCDVGTQLSLNSISLVSISVKSNSTHSMQTPRFRAAVGSRLTPQAGANAIQVACIWRPLATTISQNIKPLLVGVKLRTPHTSRQFASGETCAPIYWCCQTVRGDAVDWAMRRSMHTMGVLKVVRLWTTL